MLLAHGPVAVLANRAIQKKKIEKLSTGQMLVIDILAMFFGILPDFDFFALIALSKPSFLHHQILTHTPFFWIIAFLIIYFVAHLLKKILNGKVEKVITKNFLNIVLLTFLISTLTHLFTDMFTGYIMLLYPFTRNGFSLFADFLAISEIDGYFSNPGMLIEFVFFILFFRYLLLQYTAVKKKMVNKISNLLLIAIAIFAPYNLYVFKNSYSVVFPQSKKNFPIYDQDKDGLLDTKDSDTDNNGKNNFEDTPRVEVLEIVEKIVTSEKNLSTEPGTIIYVAYQELNKSLQPVLVNYANKKYEDHSEYKYNALLYEYLEENLVDYESDADLIPGNFVFVLDKKDDVINLGIVREDKSIALMFETSTRKSYDIKDLGIYYALDDIRIVVEK